MPSPFWLISAPRIACSSGSIFELSALSRARTRGHLRAFFVSGRYYPKLSASSYMLKSIEHFPSIYFVNARQDQSNLKSGRFRPNNQLFISHLDLVRLLSIHCSYNILLVPLSYPEHSLVLGLLQSSSPREAVPSPSSSPAPKLLQPPPSFSKLPPSSGNLLLVPRTLAHA